MSSVISEKKMEKTAPRTPRVLYISPGDPWGNPRGGQTAFAKQMLNAFGDRLAVVAPDESGVAERGVWTVGEWKNVPIWRFNVGSYAPKNKSKAPIIPRRIVFRNLIQKNLSKIRKLGVENLFCDSPEILGVLTKYPWNSVCYLFAGLNNPVAFSRYPFLRILRNIFHSQMMKDLMKLSPDLLLAAADSETIKRFETENRKYLGKKEIISFPTRFDSSVFYPGEEDKMKKTLQIDRFYPILVCVGRISWIKNWNLALETLKSLKIKYSNPLLIFVGDGEDRRKLEKRIDELNLDANVRVEGFLSPSETRRRLVAADIYLVTSWREGWSVAATEALGCGKVIVSSDVSGANEMIFDEKNGKIVKTREPEDFAKAIEDSLDLVTNGISNYSLNLSQRFSTSTLYDELGKIWSQIIE